MSVALDELKRQAQDAVVTWDKPVIEVNAYHLRELLARVEELEEQLADVRWQAGSWGMHP